MGGTAVRSRPVRISKSENLIPNAPFVEYMEKHGISVYEISHNIYGDRDQASRNYTYLARRLGIMPYNSHGRRVRQTRISYELGVKIALAMGADPIDVGV